MLEFLIDSIELKESELTLARMIQLDLYKLLKDKFNINISLKNKIQTIIRQTVARNPTYVSILKNEEGELLPELGLPYRLRTWVATGLLDLIAEGVEVTTTFESGLFISVKDEMSVDVDILWSNAQSEALIKRGEGRYISAKRFELGKGINTTYEIPWLEWLLDGGSAFISGYRLDFNDDGQAGSRTGFALMKRGGDWKFPAKYANSPQKNFITESIETAQPLINQLILDTFNKKVGP